MFGKASSPAASPRERYRPRLSLWVACLSSLGPISAVPGADATEPIYAVNCGSPLTVQIGNGTVFNPDQRYVVGGGYGTRGGTLYRPDFDQRSFYYSDEADDLPLHSTQMLNSAGYAFELDPGRYEVEIHMTEFYRHGVGHWSTQVLMEGIVAIPSFDPLSAVGKSRAYRLRQVIEVADGVLDVTFGPPGGDVTVSGIAVWEAEPGLPPEAPSNVVALDTYGGVHLRWDGKRSASSYRVLRESLSPPLTHDGSKRNFIQRWTLVAERILPFAEIAAESPARYGVLSLDAYGQLSDTTFVDEIGPRDPEQCPLPTYGLNIAPEDRRALDSDVFANDLWVEADFIVDGDPRPGVQVSYRGKAQRGAPKKSWNVRMEDNPPLLDADRVALKGTFIDPTMQRELLMADLLTRAGVPHSQTFPVRFELNGQHAGNLLHVERVDPDFLTRQGWDPGGRFFRVNCELSLQKDIHAYRMNFENANTPDWDRREVIELVEGLERIPEEDILPWLETQVDIEAYLELVVHHSATANQDWLRDDYYLYRSEGSPWRVVPWDLHEIYLWDEQPLGYGTREIPAFRGIYNRLWDRVLNVPSLHRRFTEKLRKRLEEHLHPDSLGSIAAARTNVLLEELDRDPNKFHRENYLKYQRSLTTLKRIFENRSAFLISELDSFEKAEHALLHIAELLPAENGGFDSVELLNLAPRPLRLTDYFLSNDRGRPAKWPIPDVSIDAGDRVVFDLPRETYDWLGLYREVGAVVLVDSVAPPEEFPVTGFGRFPDSSGRWRTLDAPSPLGPNLWTAPVDLSLTVEPAEPHAGDHVEFVSRMTNRAATRWEGQWELTLMTRDGIYPRPHPIAKQTVAVPAEATQSLEWSIQIPRRGVDPGGYRLLARLLDSSGAEVSRDEREVFLVQSANALVINEFMAINDGVLEDEFGEFDDWVELHNPSANPISTAGYYLTDDSEDNLLKWALPDLEMAPGAHLLIWCDNSPDQGPLHTSFKLSGGGEELALVRNLGPGSPKLQDHWVFGAQVPDTAEGRYPDGNATWLVPDEPTPGDENFYTPR